MAKSAHRLIIVNSSSSNAASKHAEVLTIRERHVVNGRVAVDDAQAPRRRRRVGQRGCRVVFASLQCALLDRHTWPKRAGLARVMFHWIEAFYNPTRHSTLGYLSPVDYEATPVA